MAGSVSRNAFRVSRLRQGIANDGRKYVVLDSDVRSGKSRCIYRVQRHSSLVSRNSNGARTRRLLAATLSTTSCLELPQEGLQRIATLVSLMVDSSCLLLPCLTRKSTSLTSLSLLWRSIATSPRRCLATWTASSCRPQGHGTKHPRPGRLERSQPKNPTPQASRYGIQRDQRLRTPAQCPTVAERTTAGPVTPGKVAARDFSPRDVVRHGLEARCAAHIRRASVASLRRRFERALNDAF